jgi:hypothetical protein
VRRQLAKAACGGTVLEEADESELWLGTARDAKFTSAPDLARSYQESVELMSIFSQANRTARANS